MKTAAFIFLGVFVGFPLLMFGTLSPCEMLKKEVKSQLVAKFAGDAQKGGFEALGSAVAFGLGGKMIDDFVDTMSPVRCAAKLIDVHFKGATLFDPSAQPTPVPLPSRTSSTSCKVDHFTWRNSGGLEILFVEGVVSPAANQTIHIKFYDAQDNFLGTSSTMVMPGGSFSTSINHRNPSNELKIKYVCG